MDTEALLIERFRCIKCRGRDCVAKTVVLGGRGLMNLLPMSGVGTDSYVFVTCALCGYTEVYNAAVVAMTEDDTKARSPMGGVPEPSVAPRRS